MNCLIPDTSAVIIGAVSNIIEKDKLNFPEIIVPEAVVSELEHQANDDKEKGLLGLKELQKLQRMQDDGKLAIYFKGRRPSNNDIKHAKSGEIDGIIRDLARTEMGTLLTADKVQAETAKAQGIPVYFVEQSIVNKPLFFERFFDELTMSVHLKENVPPMAKKGRPGNVQFVKLTDEPLTQGQIKNIVKQIVSKQKYNSKSFFESKMEGSYVIQYNDYRISIAYPPFSEAIEITVVKPIINVDLDEYKLSTKLLDRIRKNAEGILISGSPGAGKSTFVQAIAKYYSKNLNKNVKTMETPRDLQLPDEITQYSPLEGSMEKTADVLLLVRPDYTIFDELRKNMDFNIFADMRLAGVGMIGVVHATRPIDAIQRIASRVELGVIPSIVDTSIYIEDGEIKSVYETKMTVKVPTGMKEADLARPVIEVRDFETNQLKNEIYTYGEQTIVMDVDLVKKSSDESYVKTSTDKIAEREIYNVFQKILPRGTRFRVDVVSPDRVDVFIPDKLIPGVIGKNGRRIDDIENQIGIHIGLFSIDEVSERDVIHDVSFITTRNNVILDLGREYKNMNFDICVNGQFIFAATSSKKGEIRLKYNNYLVEDLINAFNRGFEISAIRNGK